MMLRILIFNLITLAGLSITGNAQKNSSRVSIRMNSYRPVNDSAFKVHIEFYALGERNININQEPFYTVSSSEFGNIKFEAEELVNNCFLPMIIHHDPDPIEMTQERSRITLKPNDTLRYEYDIRNSIPMDKGVYRLRVHIVYSTAIKKGIEQLSNWIYYEVPIDGISVPKSNNQP